MKGVILRSAAGAITLAALSLSAWAQKPGAAVPEPIHPVAVTRPATPATPAIPEVVRLRILSAYERLVRLNDAIERAKVDLCNQSPQCKSATDNLANEVAAYNKLLPEQVKEAGLPVGTQFAINLSDPDPAKRLTAIPPVPPAPPTSPAPPTPPAPPAPPAHQ